MGTFAKDDYETAGRAALIGGTTTIFDIVLPGAGTPSRRKVSGCGTEQSAGRAACDYSFHMGVTRFDDTTTGQLREIVGKGVASFKIFPRVQGSVRH